MSVKKAGAEKRKFEITIRAEVVEDAEESYTIMAVSLAEATKKAVENFEAEYNRAGGNIEIEAAEC